MNFDNFVVNFGSLSLSLSRFRFRRTNTSETANVIEC